MNNRHVKNLNSFQNSSRFQLWAILSVIIISFILSVFIKTDIYAQEPMPISNLYTISIPKHVYLNKTGDGKYSSDYEIIMKSCSLQDSSKIIVSSSSSLYIRQKDTNRERVIINDMDKSTNKIDNQILFEESCENDKRIGYLYAENLSAGEWNTNITFHIALETVDNTGDILDISEENSFIKYNISAESALEPTKFIKKDKENHYEIYETSSKEEIYDPVSIKIPEKFTKIGNKYFERCINLVNVIIPQTVTYIGDYAFSDCSNISTIELSDNIAEIGTNAFKNCENLSVIYYKGKPYEKRDELISALLSHNVVIGAGAFNSLSEDVITLNIGDLEQYNIEANESNIVKIPKFVTNNDKKYKVTKLGDWLFSDKDIAGVEFPDSITEIGEGCFFDCRNIESIILPVSVKTIKKDAFMNCTSLLYVDLNNCEELGEDAFAGCNPEIVVKPHTTKVACFQQVSCDTNSL